MINELLLLIACHFIGDFPFQPSWMAEWKGKSWEINFYHAMVYTCTFIIFAKVSLMFALVLLVSHFMIDPLKSRYKVIKYIWIDQLLHLIIIVIYFMMGV